jgi:hypothetical protein
LGFAQGQHHQLVCRVRVIAQRHNARWHLIKGTALPLLLQVNYHIARGYSNP